MPKIQIVGETSYPKSRIIELLMNIIKGRLMAIKEDLNIIEKDLAEFRQRYSLSDDQFLQKFNKGELSDVEAFFLWEGSLKLQTELKKEERILMDVL